MLVERMFEERMLVERMLEEHDTSSNRHPFLIVFL
jgi:hypothetical protein